MVLLHDETVWGLVDAWLESLTDAHFMQVVPLVRRSFADFSRAERQQLGSRAVRGRPSGAPLIDLNRVRSALRKGLPA